MIFPVHDACVLVSPTTVDSTEVVDVDICLANVMMFLTDIRSQTDVSSLSSGVDILVYLNDTSRKVIGYLPSRAAIKSVGVPANISCGEHGAYGERPRYIEASTQVQITPLGLCLGCFPSSLRMTCINNLSCPG